MSISKNYLLNIIYQLVITLIPVLTIPILTRRIGIENLGNYSFLLSITTYFSIFAQLSITTFGTKKIAAYRDDKSKYSVYFWNIFALKSLSSLLSLVMFITSYILFDFSIIFLLQGIVLVANLFDITWFYMGIENFKDIIIRNTLIRITTFVLVILLVKNDGDLWLYALIISLGELVGALIMWINLTVSKKVLRPIKIKPFEEYKDVLMVFIPQLIITVYTTLNITLLGILSNDYEVSLFDYSSKIILIIISLLTSLGMVVLPRISNLFKNSKHSEINVILNNSIQLFMYLGIPLVFGLSIIAPVFIPWFLGQDYIGAVPLMIIFSIKILLVSLSNVIGMQYLIPTNQNKKFLISVIFGALACIILNIILIPRNGALGAVISIIISELLVTLSQILLTFNKVNFTKMILSTWKSLVAGLLMIPFSLLFVNKYETFTEVFNSINSNIITVLFIIITVGISGLVYILLGVLLKNETQKDIIKRLFKMIFNK